jgi:hypothetical protein
MRSRCRGLAAAGRMQRRLGRGRLEGCGCPRRRARRRTPAPPAPEPRAVQPRVRDGKVPGAPLARAGPRGRDRRRPYRRRRRAQGRKTGEDGRAACRYGRAAGDRTDRPAVRLDGQVDLRRPRCRRHACLRSRRPHGDPARRRRAAGRAQGGAAGGGEVHLPAGRGGYAAGRGGWRRADGQAGRSDQCAAAGRDLRSAPAVDVRSGAGRLAQRRHHGRSWSPRKSCSACRPSPAGRWPRPKRR